MQSRQQVARLNLFVTPSDISTKISGSGFRAISRADLNKGSLSSRLPAPTYSQVRCTDVRRVVTNLI